MDKCNDGKKVKSSIDRVPSPPLVIIMRAMRKEYSSKTWKKFGGKEWPNDDHGEEAESQEDINDAEPKTMLSQVGSSAELGLVLMLNKPWVHNLMGAMKCCPIIGAWVVQKWIPENRSHDRL